MRLLDQAISEQEKHFGANIYQSHRRCTARRIDDTTVHSQATSYATAVWSNPQFRLERCGGKRALADLNRLLQGSGQKAVTPRGIVKKMKIGEIPEEMRAVILRINALVAAIAGGPGSLLRS